MQSPSVSKKSMRPSLKRILRAMSQGKGFVDIVDHFFVGTHMAKIKVHQSTKNDTPQDIRPDYEGIYPFHTMMRHGVYFLQILLGCGPRACPMIDSMFFFKMSLGNVLASILSIHATRFVGTFWEYTPQKSPELGF